VTGVLPRVRSTGWLPRARLFICTRSRSQVTMPANCRVLHESGVGEANTHSALAVDAAAAFAYCDVGHKGWLSRRETRLALIAVLDYSPSDLQIDAAMRAALARDSVADHHERLRFETFVTLASDFSNGKFGFVRKLPPPAHQLFAALDTRGNGWLSLQDLVRVFGQVAPHVPLGVVERVFTTMDTSGVGRVGIREFESLLVHLDDEFPSLGGG
jgi:Ca2+-binding EF-hand superfamily protein